MQLGESQLVVSDNPEIGPLQLTIGYKRVGEGLRISIPPIPAPAKLPETPPLVPPPPKVEIPVKWIIPPVIEPKREVVPPKTETMATSENATLEAILNEITMSRMHLNEIRFLLMSIDRSLRVPPWYVRLWRWIKSKLRRG
jgi:hypothetical protein